MGKVAAKKAPAKRLAARKPSKQPIVFTPPIEATTPPPPVTETAEPKISHPQIVTFFNQQQVPALEGLGSGHRVVYFSQEGRRVVLLDVATFDTAAIHQDLWDDTKKQEFQFRPRILFESLQREVSKNGSNRRLRQYMQTVLPEFATRLKEPVITVAATAEGEAPKQSKKESQVYRFLKGVPEGMPRQAVLIFEAMTALQKKRKVEFLTLLEAEAEVTSLKEALKTKQDPWRVFKFYQSQFIQKGLLRITNG